jgi:hypothetical protein
MAEILAENLQKTITVKNRQCLLPTKVLTAGDTEEVAT